MNWEKAKNILIILLVLVNLGLLGLNQQQKEKYALTHEQETAILSVLDQYGIALEGALVQNAPPMRELTVSIPPTDLTKLRRQFFGEDASVTTSVAFNQTILTGEGKSLTVANNEVTFTQAPEGPPIANFSLAAAEDAALEYMNRLMGGQSNVQLGAVTEAGDGYLFTYYELYKGYRLFGCRREILVRDTGIASFYAVNYEVEGMSTQRQGVCSADEALLTFCYEMRAEDKTGLVIEEMTLGYDFQEVQEIEQGNTLKMVPCYSVRVAGEEVPYIINAYTNEMQKANLK